MSYDKLLKMINVYAQEDVEISNESDAYDALREELNDALDFFIKYEGQDFGELLWNLKYIIDNISNTYQISAKNPHSGEAKPSDMDEYTAKAYRVIFNKIKKGNK